MEEQAPPFATPGHEEIELALVKLYRCTGEERYLRLARWFLDQRGNNDKDPACMGEWENPRYTQSHLPGPPPIHRRRARGAGRIPVQRDGGRGV